ncbi:MAG: replicative DNA helicase [Eubacterium sp.]|nr:replicative DNA helicase [Eubacterium sp.]
MPENNNSSNQSLLPYNLDAEQSVLGSILIEPDCMELIIDKIKAEYFYLPQNQKIFSSMVTMYAGSKAKIDPVVIADMLVKEGLYDDAGGREYLLTLRDSVPSTANIEAYAKIVEEQYYLRTLITVSNKIISDAQSGETDVNDLLASAEQQIYDISRGKEISGPKKISDVIINDVYDNLYKITGEDKDQYKGVSTGFSTLDKYITGLNKSDFILIGARPAMGKTSFALNLAQNVTMYAKKKCIFFSLEMSKKQLADRLLASFAGIPSQKLLTGELDKDEWARLGNAAGAFNDVELYLDDTASITVPEIKSRVMRLKNVDIIIIDYLSLIQAATKRDNRAQEVSEITRHLKMLAKDLMIPVVCCAQLNRGTEGRGKSHKPQLSDLRESGSIEQDADIVMFLYREEYYKGELDEEKQEDVDISKTELIVAKNRHGPTGSIEMTFDKEFTRFRTIDKQYEN